MKIDGDMLLMTGDEHREFIDAVRAVGLDTAVRVLGVANLKIAEWGGGMTVETRLVLMEVEKERQKQDEKWGEQNHPSFAVNHDFAANTMLASGIKGMVDHAAKQGKLAWSYILSEECAEAFAEQDPAKLRGELIQVAAVATAWIECLDRQAEAEDYKHAEIGCS